MRRGHMECNGSILVSTASLSVFSIIAEHWTAWRLGLAEGKWTRDFGRENYLAVCFLLVQIQSLELLRSLSRFVLLAPTSQLPTNSH